MTTALEKPDMNTEELLAGQTITPAEEEQNSVQSTSRLSREEIIDSLRKLVEGSVEEVKDEVDELKQAYYKQKKIEIEEARNAFIAAGNPGAEFVPMPDEQEETLKSLLSVFREKKAEYTALLEKQREENLERKQQILEEMKSITEDSDNINRQYTRFQELQQSFKEPCELPSAAVSGLWKKFQSYVENFYDLLKINKELRDYDFKKNLELKTALCEAAEKLADEPDVISAFHQLQKLHQEFREIGPVARELREEIWARFKAASTVVNKRHQEYFEKRKEQEQMNLDQKTAICEVIEGMDLDSLKTFAEWNACTEQITSLQAKWKTIGFAPQKMNVKIFERFRAACDNFFKRKSEFFKSVKDSLNANLKLKRELCEKAEALKDSTDWKATSDILVKLQKDWKEIGTVPKKYSDALWHRFIGACDAFFEAKNKATSSVKGEQLENLEKKKALIEKIKSVATEGVDEKELREQIRSLQGEWNAIGHVPFKEKDKVYNAYREQIDRLFKAANMTASRRRLDRFKQEMGSDTGRLRDKLTRQYEILKNEIKTYENNLGFLNLSSKNSSGLVDEINRKIEKLKSDLQEIEAKIAAVDEKQNK